MKEILFMSAVMIALALAGALGDDDATRAAEMLNSEPALPPTLAIY
ncbi:hypothetical protein HKCCE3408_12735 [Rhodobacterales bacterium HKCCE3408]|nr:hypothetical protein [Rhodobacterales bacterium HKCCE3408]